jgi:hypothetical protein
MPEATTSYSEPTAVTPVSASSNQSSVTSEEPTVTAVQRKNEAPLEVAAEETQIWQPKAQESTPIQASPLQTVWPVQRVDTPPMAKPTAVAPAAPPIMRQPAPEVIQAKEQLAAIPTVMPSDSSVAMMAPRRPRPTALAKETAVTTPSTQPTATTETTIPTPPIPTIQRQPEAVPTEIGELPSDLWQLIGQEPPHTAPTKVAPPTKPANGNGTAVVQREAATQSPPTETSPNTEAPDTTLEAAAGPEGGDEEKKTEEEIDIDELARQVYSELKYQLSIEWERIRGRHELNNW